MHHSAPRPRLLGIVGTNAGFSFNRILLRHIRDAYADRAEVQLQEIGHIPLFNEDDMKMPPAAVADLWERIAASDGVVFGVPEYDHSVPAALKSVLEWCSVGGHPLRDKPVMIVGGSYGGQGTVRAQIHLRQILDAPGLNARVLPNNQFMLPGVKDKFGSDGTLTHESSAAFLDECVANFLAFVRN